MADAAPEVDAAERPLTLEERARELSRRLIVLDGHVDLPYRLMKQREAGSPLDDVATRTSMGDFDFPRAREGGLDAPFMSIYVAPRYERRGAFQRAEELIEMVERIVRDNPERFALARSPAEVRANFETGKISLPLGMENGAPIEGKLKNVAHFHARGVRYITLAHSKANHLSDSSYDAPLHRGLSAFGKQVVREMNRVGILVDVSHLSDAAFYQVIATTEVPVIASHSGCRKFTPGWQRNMDDAMLDALKQNGGVIQINFGSIFLDDEVRKQRAGLLGKLSTQARAKGLTHGSPAYEAFSVEFWKEHPTPRATVARVADHIDHVVQRIGVDHVGLGSDFEGVGDTLPVGLEDVSKYPNLIQVLLERGYTEPQIEQILSGNVLRVWQAAEDYARTRAATAGASDG